MPGLPTGIPILVSKENTCLQIIRLATVQRKSDFDLTKRSESVKLDNMTLPDIAEDMIPQNKQEKKTANLLKVVLRKARDDNRITSGVVDCASRLELEPETVMLCLLPQVPSNDLATSIQHKLIEAHCMELDIHVIQVDSCNKLSEIVSKDEPVQKTVNKNPVTTATVDGSCILIRYPDKAKANKSENGLMTRIWPNQFIQLPI